MNNVLLIQPSCADDEVLSTDNLNLPLGLAYFAGIFDKFGYNIKVLDIEVSKELVLKDILDEIRTYKPNIVGFSLTTPAFNETKKIIENIKLIDKSIITIIGCPHSIALPEETIEQTKCDICIVGEGEATLTELIGIWKKEGDLRGIEGICYYNSEGVIIKTENRNYIKDIDDLPLPLRDKFQMEKYKVSILHRRRLTSKVSTKMAIRGCPYNCRFCFISIWKTRYRQRKISAVVDEMNTLLKGIILKKCCYFYLFHLGIVNIT